VPTTLLAIDDSVTMRKVLEMTFAGEDFRVVSADSADAAFAKLRSERPSIVLCDVTLEGAGGYAVCAKIKAENPTIAVLLLASKQQPYDAHKGQSARADDFIEKPFDTQQLIDKVKRLATRPVDVRQAAPATPPMSVGPATQPGVAPIGSGPGRPPPAPAAPARAPGGPPAAPQNRPPVPGVAGSVGRSTMAYGAYAMQNPAAPAAPPQAPAASSPPGYGARPPVAPAAPSPPTASAAPPAPATPHGGTSPGLASPVAGVAAASSAVAVAASASNGQLAAKLQHLGLSDAQVSAVLSLSREVIEKVVWEVVPVLAETMIREELKRLTSD
jgi:CheY-like chemotaxis protein